jgi:hypothetical protein
MAVRVILRTETSQKSRLDETAITIRRLWGLFSEYPRNKWRGAPSGRGCEQPQGELHGW